MDTVCPAMEPPRCMAAFAGGEYLSVHPTAETRIQGLRRFLQKQG